MRILLIEDDIEYLGNYIAEIEKEYIVDVAYTASDGCYMSEVTDYDIIVVDEGLPNDDGILVCRDIRNANIAAPILMLAISDDSMRRMNYLKDGANVCISKKVSVSELSAQIKALVKLKHAYGGPNKVSIDKTNKLQVDMDLQKVIFDDGEILLRKKEYSILEYLLLNRGRPVSKEELLDHIWEEGILVKSNSLEVHIRNIRLKLERPFDAKVIKTIRGVGYRID